MISTLLGIESCICGEASGTWPSSLIHPLTGNTGGSYKAVPEGTFMDSKYSRTNEHVAVDIAAPNGMKVYAIADGTVITAAGSGRDRYIVVSHQIGKTKFLAIYGHVIKTSSGSTIGKGKELGIILDYDVTVKGSAGDHLHFGVFEGTNFSKWENGKQWGWGKVPSGTSKSDVESFGWRDPVPFLRGLTPVSPALIEVSGIKAINNGDTNASTSDGTYQKGGKNQKLRFSFAIRNIGKSPLTINSCVLKYADRGFTITRSPKTTISPGSYSTLEIEFRSSSYGYNYADVEIRSSSDKDAIFKYEIKALISK